MSTKSKKSIADSLETEEKLLPYIPFLLQDLWVLGSSIDQIIETVGTLNKISPIRSVLDLGCGKGAVSIQLAERYGLRVVGIDAMIPFLEAAKEKAAEYNVSHLCKFINQDIHEYVSNEHNYDLVLLAAMGGIFGSLKNTVAQMRTQIRTGGFIMIDDGFLKKDDSLDRKRYEHYKNYNDTVRGLTHFSDKIVEQINTSATSNKINKEYHSLITKRGEELISKHKELVKDIRDYILLQEEECNVLENEIEGVLWVIQKV